MATTNYGVRYWCVKTAKNEDVYFHADRVECTPNGDLIGWGGHSANSDRGDVDLQVVLSLAAGRWIMVYAASCIDGGAVAVEHWDAPRKTRHAAERVKMA
jgi:hypothetical protein